MKLGLAMLAPLQRRLPVLLLCLAVTGPAAVLGAPSVPDNHAVEDDAVLRQTKYGKVEGVRRASDGTLEWLGLPYAKPPVGDLRWKAPAEPGAWSGTKSLRSFGASCIQGGRLFSPSPATNTYDLSVRDGLGKPVGAEDCLTLNIWRPGTSGTKLPVIVFIHGGSNVTGYSADPIYHGARLATKANAIVVTMNYRLGLLGWFDAAELKTGEPRSDSGNFGLLDQIQALKFIQSEIASFGGDPTNVTVMGESAGAVNVWGLLVSPQARGLFHKAVSMSGGLVNKSSGEARDYARSLLRAVLIDDGKAGDAVGADLHAASMGADRVAAYLRSMGADRLIRVAIAAKLPDAPAVIQDGSVIPLVPQAAIASGQYNKVPMLASNTLDEGKLFGGVVGAYRPSDRERFTLMNTFDPDRPSALTAADFIQPAFVPVDQPVTGWNDVSRVLTTGLFWTMTQNSLNTLALAQSDAIWYCRFDWRGAPAPFADVYGAAHALDLPFWFGNFERNFFSFAFSQSNRAGREKLSEEMMRTIGVFATTGKPYHVRLGTGSWPAWPSGLVFDATPDEARIRPVPLVLP